MPNFTGVMARPRFTSSCSALNAAIRARRASKSLETAQVVPDRPQPFGVAHRLAVRASSGRARRGCARGASRHRCRARGATRPRTSSITNMPCGPPKPRNAVCEVLFVFAMRPCATKCGIQYALSTWQSARPITGSERSRLQPPSEVSVVARAMMRPSSSNPAFHVDVERMPLAGHREVLRAVEPQPHGRPVSIAPSAATRRSRAAASPCRRSRRPCAAHCTVTRLFGRPSTCATISCVSDGCCVLHSTNTCPSESMRASEACVSR